MVEFIFTWRSHDQNLPVVNVVIFEACGETLDRVLCKFYGSDAMTLVN
jgi:hypothetical protein